MQQQQQSFAMPGSRFRTGISILTSLLLIAGSTLIPIVIKAFLGEKSIFGIFVLALSQLFVFGYSFFSLARVFSRIYGAIAVGLAYQLAAWTFLYLWWVFNSDHRSPMEALTYGYPILIALITVALLSLSFVIYGLINICQQRYLP